MAAKNGILKDACIAASRLPWWMCLVLAIVSYGVLHFFAVSDPFKGVSGYAAVFPGLLKGFALVGQYVLPVIFVAAGVMSVIRWREKRSGSKGQ